MSSNTSGGHVPSFWFSFAPLRLCGNNSFSKTRDRFDYVSLLRVGELRINGQRQRLARRALRLGKLAFFVTEISKTFLPVQRNWIIHFCAHAVSFQVFHHRVAMLRNANHVLMKDVTRL